MDRQLDIYLSTLTKRNDMLVDGFLFPFRTAAKRIARWWTSFQAARDRQAAIRHLQAFDDRLLRDIGIARHEIRRVVTSAMASTSEPSNATSDMIFGDLGFETASGANDNAGRSAA